MKNEYQNGVAKAKLLMAQRSTAKYEIVKIALKVCVIKEGNNTSHSTYTLTQFAKDIGIAKGTLSRWKLEYENVLMKVKTNGTVNSYAMNETMRKVTSKTPKSEVEKIYNSFTKKTDNPENRTLIDYSRRLKGAHFFICYSIVLSKVDQKVLDEIAIYCDEISKAIKNKKTKRVDHKKRYAKEIKRVDSIMSANLQ